MKRHETLFLPPLYLFCVTATGVCTNNTHTKTRTTQQQHPTGAETLGCTYPQKRRRAKGERHPPTTARPRRGNQPAFSDGIQPKFFKHARRNTPVCPACTELSREGRKHKTGRGFSSQRSRTPPRDGGTQPWELGECSTATGGNSLHRLNPKKISSKR